MGGSRERKTGGDGLSHLRQFVFVNCTKIYRIHTYKSKTARGSSIAIEDVVIN